MPWGSVFAMVGEDGRGMVWPDDVPQELAVRVVDEQGKTGELDRAPVSSEDPTKPKAVPSAPGRGRRAPGEPAVKEVPSDRDRTSRPKRAAGKKGKKEERPVLMAVPSARESSKELPLPLPLSAAKKPEAKPAPAAPPTPISQRPANPSNRPKRELPPYLRVVK